MAPSGKKRRVDERGIALMLVIIAIAVLTAVATEFAYNSRVDLQMATNQRDEIRAYYLAKSGVGLSRLVLKFQKQLDNIQMPPGVSQLLAGLMPPSPTGGAQSPMPTGLNLQLWKMAKIDCEMLRGMVKSDVPERPGASGSASGASGSGGKFDFDQEFSEVALKQHKRSFGGFEGCFNATLTDEEQKINVARLDAPQLSSQPTVMSLLALFTDKRFDFLWEDEDANRVKVTPQEVILNIKDWIDEDEVGSTLNLSGQGDILARGFSDENSAYDRYTPRYKAKNARFDSLDELYLVHGVNDRFMAAFRDRLTVYPDINRNFNVNTDDPVLLYLAVLSVADPIRPDPRLTNPLFVEQLIQQIKTARMFNFFGTSVQDFVNVVAAAGVPVNQTILNNVQNNRMVSDKSQTYSIKSVGTAGEVEKTITVVVRTDDQLGKLLYWREE